MILEKVDPFNVPEEFVKDDKIPSLSIDEDQSSSSGRRGNAPNSLRSIPHTLKL